MFADCLIKGYVFSSLLDESVLEVLDELAVPRVQTLQQLRERNSNNLSMLTVYRYKRY